MPLAGKRVNWRWPAECEQSKAGGDEKKSGAFARMRHSETPAVAVKRPT